MSKEKILIELRKHFNDEFLTSEGSWRIFRITTLIDILVYNYFLFNANPFSKYLIEIFNLSVKIKILFNLGEMKISNDIITQYAKIQEDREKILKNYNNILENFEDELKKEVSISRKTPNLYEKINYIKVILELEIDSFSEDDFDEIMNASFTLLNQQI